MKGFCNNTNYSMNVPFVFCGFYLTTPMVGWYMIGVNVMLSLVTCEEMSPAHAVRGPARPDSILQTNRQTITIRHWRKYSNTSNIYGGF